MSQKSDASTRPATLAEGLGTLDSGAKLAANQLLGPYRLVRQLGEGGMGVVWLADQLQPFERKVAIKLSNRQSGSNMANAYFEIERQALAQLVHPYIAQIYDAGVRADGTLYFAMEYVEGSTLDEFLIEKPVSLDACIALLIQVCQGAHYAHQRGLIHRDLKPGNVLIAEVSGSPMPKIIDFGIAIGVDTARTGTSASAGTRAYMAPEQFNAQAGGLDLRADVYALGAILIESLCLQLKIPLNGLDSGTFRGLLSAAGTSANPVKNHTHVPANLRAELRRIPKALRSIAIKAMADDREQRYESAASMADDLKRWRERRPVLAMQGGKLYALRCFINRYRLASALGAATIAALIGGLIVASYGLRQATIAKAQAELRREQAESLVDYMLGDFAAKLEPIGKLDLIDGVATRALEYLQQANDSDLNSAIHRAAALRTIGDVQTRRGQWAQAKATFALAEQVLGKAEAANANQVSPELLFEQGQVAYWIGYTHYSERDFNTAKIHWQRYLALAEQLVPLTVESGLGLNELINAISNMGTLAFNKGEINWARDLFERAIVSQQTGIKKFGENEKSLLQLATLISWLAKTQETNGEITNALASYKLQLSTLEKARNINFENVKTRVNIAYATHFISLLELQLGHSEDSLKNLIFVVDELIKLTNLDDSQMQWARLLAVSRSELAWTLFFRNENERAIEEINLALKMQRQFLANQPSLKDQRAYAVAMFRKAIFLSATGEVESSRVLFKLAHVNLAKLHLENPDDRKTTIAFTNSLLNFKDSIELSENALQALNLLIKLAEKQEEIDVLDGLVRANVVLGNIKSAIVYAEKLERVKYQHPQYRDFLKKNQFGAIQ